MNRRTWLSRIFLALGGLALLGSTRCTQTDIRVNDVLVNLRRILLAAEAALRTLEALGLDLGLTHICADYLRLVARFVDDAARVLEDDSRTVAQKAAAILKLALPIAVPQVPPRVANVLNAVQAALDAFLGLFRGQQPDNYVGLSEADRRFAVTIEVESRVDVLEIERWEGVWHPATPVPA